MPTTEIQWYWYRKGLLRVFQRDVHIHNLSTHSLKLALMNADGSTPFTFDQLNHEKWSDIKNFECDDIHYTAAGITISSPGVLGDLYYGSGGVSWYTSQNVYTFTLSGSISARAAVIYQFIDAGDGIPDDNGYLLMCSPFDKLISATAAEFSIILEVWGGAPFGYLTLFTIPTP